MVSWITITSLGAREELNQAVHSWGGITLHDVIDNRFAHKAVEKGADGLILVATGAGGHAGRLSPFALVQEVREWFDGPVALSGAIANGRSILHAGDGVQHASAVPDVCKTPSPGGPVPVPYVNVASDSDLAKGTKRVKIGGKSVALASSHLSTSVGDEPGTAGGGLASSKTKGKMTWGSASADVKFEGKAVHLLSDMTTNNE